GGAGLVDHLLQELAAFTGADWEQEDDVTLVTLQRRAAAPAAAWQPLATFTIPSAPDNERQAMRQVAAAIAAAGLPLAGARLERLQTAVAEATMNAMEHGNRYDPDKPVSIDVAHSETAVRVRITDQGGGKPAAAAAAAPDLAAKLAGEQSPRGWGLFLIQNMVDEMHTHQDETQHTVELRMHLD
ncbi:MAG: ATP-binding protein, partial [Anaerolineales bacterium]|nr:ATP-binding protein [Anaerolineales bacterium]